jgi:multiple sugar transport system substrate-binding protein
MEFDMTRTLSRRQAMAGTFGLAGTALALTACGGSAGPTSDVDMSAPQSTDVSGSLSYSIWNPDQAVQLEEVIAAFNEEYPDVEVAITVTPFDQYWTRLQTQANGDNLPDVFWMNGPNIQLYAAGEQILNLEELFSSGQLDKANYPEAMVQLYTFEESSYAVPKDYDTIGLWYNRRLFDDAGEAYPDATWTWEDFQGAAARLTEALPEGTFGAAISWQSNQTGYYNAIYQAGGHVLDDDATTSGYGEPEAIEGIEFLRSLVEEGSVPNVSQDNDNPANQRFANGGAAMLWGGSWESANLANGSEAEHVSATSLPAGAQKATIIHGLGNAVSATTANPEAAIAFVTFLGSEKAARIMAEAGTVISAFNGSQQAYVDSYPSMDLQVFLDAAEDHAVAMPASQNTLAWSSLESDYLPDALSGTAPVPDAMAGLAAAVDKVLADEV